MTEVQIKAIPCTYAGVRFRSTLEANWAATLDSLKILWSYEPVAVETSAGAYLPDFWLPGTQIWAEVKGPHNEGLHKTRALTERHKVVVLRPPLGAYADWEDVQGWEGFHITKDPKGKYHFSGLHDVLWDQHLEGDKCNWPIPWCPDLLTKPFEKVIFGDDPDSYYIRHPECDEAFNSAFRSARSGAHEIKGYGQKLKFVRYTDV